MNNEVIAFKRYKTKMQLVILTGAYERTQNFEFGGKVCVKKIMKF